MDKELAPKKTEEEQQKTLNKAAEAKDFDTVNKGLDDMLRRFRSRKQGNDYKNSAQVLKDMFFNEEKINLKGIIDRDKNYCNQVQNDFQVDKTKGTSTRLDTQNRNPTMIALGFMKSHLDQDAKKGIKQSKIVRDPEVTLQNSEAFQKRKELWASSVAAQAAGSPTAAKVNSAILGKALLSSVLQSQSASKPSEPMSIEDL